MGVGGFGGCGGCADKGCACKEVFTCPRRLPRGLRRESPRGLASWSSSVQFVLCVIDRKSQGVLQHPVHESIAKVGRGAAPSAGDGR